MYKYLWLLTESVNCINMGVTDPKMTSIRFLSMWNPWCSSLYRTTESFEENLKNDRDSNL